MGDVGSGTRINAEQVLAAYGMTAADVNAVAGSFQDGVDGIKDGKVDADVNVTITTGGGNVTAVEMSWTVPANTASGVEIMTVSIKTQYNYTQQKISLD